MQNVDGMMPLFPAHVDCERSLDEIYDRTSNEVSFCIKFLTSKPNKFITF